MYAVVIISNMFGAVIVMVKKADKEKTRTRISGSSIRVRPNIKQPHNQSVCCCMLSATSRGRDIYSKWSKLTSSPFWEMASFQLQPCLPRNGGNSRGSHEFPILLARNLQTALLETDWTKKQERVQAAESAMDERQRVLSPGHGGTPEERQSLADAISGLKLLRREAADWQDRRTPDGASAQPD
jgi:hypothetical protein